MSDVLGALVTGLLVTHNDVLARLSGWKGGLAVLVLTFFAGVGAMATVGEFASHETRIGTVETWIAVHEDTVTRPRVRQIDRIEATQVQTQARLVRIEVLLSCLYYEIERCPDPAPNPPPSGGG